MRRRAGGAPFVLSDLIGVRSHFRRSVNIERDASQPSVIQTYIPSGRSLEMLQRFARAMAQAERARAWSLTGPYGCGKSSFALFLDALVGPHGDPGREVADNIVRSVDVTLATAFESARLDCGGRHGFVRAIAVAEREPVSETLLRALRFGVERNHRVREINSTLVEEIVRIDEAAREGQVPSGQRVLTLIKRVAQTSPLLLIVDEFGKNLEAFADAGRDADLFVLQQVAELAAGDRGLPIFLITLQHQAFEEYTAQAVTPQLRREWAKVQGRFEDVSFLDAGEFATRLIASVFEWQSGSAKFQERVEQWASVAFKGCKSLGLGESFGNDPQLVAQCYPLHPLAVLALPELCARYGQNERTLMGFIAGGGSCSVASFLQQIVSGDAALPCVGLNLLYDYFVESSANVAVYTSETARWFEVETRIREADDLPPEGLALLQTIGVLNLIGAGGALRASQPMLAFAVDPSGIGDKSTIGESLGPLEERGLVTYRKYADEYRIWQGTDFDLQGGISAARERLRGEPLALLLERITSPSPVVAGRHSQRTGLLRFFSCAWVDSFTGLQTVRDRADGLIMYVVGDEPDLGADVGDVKPRILVRTRHLGPLREAISEAAAIHQLLEQDEVLRSDWVARRELQERLVLAETMVRDAITAAFWPGREGVSWLLLGANRLLDAHLGLSRMLSNLCDDVYWASPEIRNEMLARRDLTSQGAKARRDLLEAMVTHQADERLAIEGYGPERAMYEAVVRYTGLHRQEDGAWRFGRPSETSGLAKMWSVLEGLTSQATRGKLAVADIYRALMRPPVGLKEGPIPVLLTALLLDRSDDIAVYEDGTYQPLLTVDLIERLVKRPDTFSIKLVDVDGPRGDVIAALAEALDVSVLHHGKRRNLPVLSVVSPLLSRIRGLPEYTLRTKRLSPTALNVRAALLAAAEPDGLVFTDLPKACGLPEFDGDASIAQTAIGRYMELLFGALSELDSLYADLIEKIRDGFSVSFRIPDGADLRADLSARARHLTSRVMERGLRSLVLNMTDPSLDEDEWLPAIAMNIVGKPPATWRDDDVVLFESNLIRLAAAFLRLEALYFEADAHQRDGFDAKRITVTAPDGTEYNDVVWVDQSSAATLEQIIGAAIEEAERRLGFTAGPALLAVLANRLYAQVQEAERDFEGSDMESSNFGAANG